jgi:hypothetical protein
MASDPPVKAEQRPLTQDDHDRLLSIINESNEPDA